MAQEKDFLFSICLSLVTFLKISTREKLTNIWPIAQGEIGATMFEAARIYFLSHAFAAFVVKVSESKWVVSRQLVVLHCGYWSEWSITLRCYWSSVS